ncbi:intradiol ring-cleavage dioxygenase [Frankia sp. Cas3]|uniref:intradiol ring-cleavage dioxygenase n=1 Tax=Frankia sp. Cas3 TaxID=3073926 RepID=UPI002AD40ED7|nr:intradiol ring-cleavage dioxygenase [Frankia sp. Cas3]
MTDFTATPLNRRRLFALGGVTLGGAALAGCQLTSLPGGSSGTGTATATPSATTSAASTCVLTSEVTEGPYWLDNSLVRKDITEGKSGAALTLRLTVVDYKNSCVPLANAAVEIWHCDAWGYYSGYTTATPGGSAPAEDGVGNEKTYLRGIQLTNSRGIVEFKTIFPGWYSPRAVHIHCKVYTGGAVDSATNTYEGGTAHHTGQFFFSDSLVTQVEATKPYGSHTGTITTLANDMVYTGKGVQDGLLTVVGSASAGFIGTIAVGVDPSFTAASGGGGGGGTPPGGTPPSGAPTGTPPSGAPGTPPTGTPPSGAPSASPTSA